MVTTSEILVRMMASVVLGGLIGYERGRHDHPAGLRTHMLVTLAAASFMLISTELFHHMHYKPSDRVTFDPSRVASYVVAGIGFLGAGSILRTGSDVKGLTTAASLWLSTAIGLAVGAGMNATAVAATALGLLILTVARIFEHRPTKATRRRFRLTLEDAGSGLAELMVRVHDTGLSASDVGIDRRLAEGGVTVVTVFARLSDGDLPPILARLEALPGVRRIKVDARGGKSNGPA